MALFKVSTLLLLFAFVAHAIAGIDLKGIDVKSLIPNNTIVKEIDVKSLLENKANLMKENLEKFKQKTHSFIKSTEVDGIAAKLAKLRGLRKEQIEKKHPGFIAEHLKNAVASVSALNTTKRILPKKQSILEVNKNLNGILYQGDILLTEKQLDRMIAKAEGGAVKTRGRRQAAVDTGYNLWDKSEPIYFKFDSTFRSTNKALFRKAAKAWSDNTCLNLVEGTGPQQMTVGEDDGCFVTGDPEDGTYVSLKHAGCTSFETYAHEIGHALGFHHTFNRHDSEDFVLLQFDEDYEYADQFKQEDEDTNDNFGLPFDLESVMMYPSDPDVGPMNSVDSRRKYIIGSENGMASTDLKMMNKLYKCHEECSNEIECRNRGFQNPNDCDVCICPRGFTGDDCSTRAKVENSALTCGGFLTATAATKTVSLKTIDPGFTSEQINAATCNWHISAPECKQIKVKFTAFTGPEIDTFPCSDFGLEFRGDKLEIAGPRICNSGQINKIYTSESNRAIVSGFTKEEAVSIAFSYWFVDDPNCSCPNLDPDCDSYDPEWCDSGSAYAEYMSENCPRYCNTC